MSGSQEKCSEIFHQKGGKKGKEQGETRRKNAHTPPVDGSTRGVDGGCTRSVDGSVDVVLVY
eukprot:COSAG02_NODE_5854_length_3987_cov_169.941872_5_plen_62_part_00